MGAEKMAQVFYHRYKYPEFHSVQFRLKETIPDVFMDVFYCCGGGGFIFVSFFY